jgi:hypothetical protein
MSYCFSDYLNFPLETVSLQAKSIPTVTNDTDALTRTSFQLWKSHGVRQMVNVDGSLAQQGGESLLQKRAYSDAH